MERMTTHTEVLIDGTGYRLAPGQDLGGLRGRIEQATQTTGTFVEFIGMGGRQLSALITPRSHVVISVTSEPVDPYDADEMPFRFEGGYDLL